MRLGAQSWRSSGLVVARTPAIAPELLRYVDDYIDETDVGSAIRADLDAASNLIVFCRELFAQLFANVVGEAITGIGGVSAQRANILRRKSGRKWPESLRLLVGHFQHFCKITRTSSVRATAVVARRGASSTSSSCQPSWATSRRGQRNRAQTISPRRSPRAGSDTMSTCRNGSRTNDECS